MDMPAGIEVYDQDQHNVDDIDFEYIAKTAEEIADALADGSPVEVAYQPGDGTFYGLVFVPLRSLETASPRVKDGQTWDAHAVRGLLDSRAPISEAGIEGINALPYNRDGYLIAWIGNAVYAMQIGNRHRDIAAGYVAEHWKCSGASAVSLAILFRAVSFHIDRIRGTKSEQEVG